MLSSVTVHAPAKINLGLHVMPKRQDGYHNIESIFSTVNLCDEITVSLSNEKNTCKVTCDGMELPLENTVTAAYKAFCVLTGCDAGCNVKITKHIPSGGGLGGGSSDASSFLKSIDILCGTKLSAEAMNLIASKVGSDVFFFTNALLYGEPNCNGYNSFAALVTGRGETVKPVPFRNDFTVLLLFPGVFVSTKEAYTLIDEHSKPDVLAVSETLAEKYRKPVTEWNFVNDFTVPVSSRFSLITEALAAIKSSGASFADMSGSGATVFGIYESRESAVIAKKVLDDRWETILV